jgi:hypothetical protein
MTIQLFRTLATMILALAPIIACAQSDNVFPQGVDANGQGPITATTEYNNKVSRTGDTMAGDLKFPDNGTNISSWAVKFRDNSMAPNTFGVMTSFAGRVVFLGPNSGAEGGWIFAPGVTANRIWMDDDGDNSIGLGGIGGDLVFYDDNNATMTLSQLAAWSQDAVLLDGGTTGDQVIEGIDRSSGGTTLTILNSPSGGSGGESGVASQSNGSDSVSALSSTSISGGDFTSQAFYVFEGDSGFDASVDESALWIARMSETAGKLVIGSVDGYTFTAKPIEFRYGTSLENKLYRWSAQGYDPKIATVTQFTANQNNLALDLTCDYQRVSSNASRDLTGIVAPTDGSRVITLCNVGNQPIVLKHQSGSSSAANWITCNTAADITLGQDGNIVLFYDTTSTTWRTVSGLTP